MANIEYSPQAKRDLNKAYQWYYNQNPKIAGSWRRELIAKVELIAKNPLQYPLAKLIKQPSIEVRQLLFGNSRGQYRILYTVVDSKTRILTIRHTSREILH